MFFLCEFTTMLHLLRIYNHGLLGEFTAMVLWMNELTVIPEDTRRLIKVVEVLIKPSTTLDHR